MIVSDHGIVDGEHTDHAYLGCTEPVKASSILEVRHDIELILRGITRAGHEHLEQGKHDDAYYFSKMMTMERKER